jgi:hypothetical protein
MISKPNQIGANFSASWETTWPTIVAEREGSAASAHA